MAHNLNLIFTLALKKLQKGAPETIDKKLVQRITNKLSRKYKSADVLIDAICQEYVNIKYPKKKKTKKVSVFETDDDRINVFDFRRTW